MIVNRLLIAAMLSAAVPLTAVACGVCIEDKVAATYDHAVITRAAQHKQTVLFFEVTGLASQAAPNQQQLIHMVENIRGVERGTVRVSLEQAALSFAVNSERQPAADVQQAVNRKLAPQHLALKLLRTFSKGMLTEPS